MFIAALAVPLDDPALLMALAPGWIYEEKIDGYRMLAGPRSAKALGLAILRRCWRGRIR